MGAIVILIAIPILLFLVYMSANNKLVALKNNRENAFADIDVLLKQRYDMVPQLVATVKGYMDHESSVLTKITEARSHALHAQNTNDKVVADNEFSKAFAAFNVQVEAYPQLKANENFIQLQGQLSNMESQLSEARQNFNVATRDLNNAIEQIPSNWVAQMNNMLVQPMFDLGASTRESLEKAPEVKF